jgi:Zn-dependent protease
MEKEPWGAILKTSQKRGAASKMSSPATNLDAIVAQFFQISDSYQLPNGEVEYRVEYRDDSKRNFEELFNKLAPLDLRPWLAGNKEDCVLVVRKRQDRSARKSRIPLIMALFSCASIALFTFLYVAIYLALAPALSAYDVVLSYGGGVVAILVAHELGHRYVARRKGLPAPAPFVLPGIPIITYILPVLGLISSPREPSVNRDTFFDVMIAGPIAGFAVALFLCVAGQLSLVQSTVQNGSAQTVIGVISVQPLNPSIIQYAVGAVLSPWSPSFSSGVMTLSPLADAAGVGLLLTFTSLIPLAFFDGGYVAASVFGERISRLATYVGVLVLILVDAPYYWALAIIVLLMAGRPFSVSTYDEISGVSVNKKIIFCIAIIIAVMSLPLPMNIATFPLG